VDAPGLLRIVTEGSLDLLRLQALAPDIDGYVDIALRSGFPQAALRLDSAARETWLDAYLEHVVTRDVRTAGQARDPVRLRRYLEVLGLCSAGSPPDNTLYQGASIDQRTADAYDRLLASLYLLDLLPTWLSNRLSRLVKRPKRYLTDTALALSAARVDAPAVLRDGDLLGRVLDTFVAAQLRPELVLLGPRTRLHHLRTEAGRQEIDLVVDLGAGRVVGIEVKASSAPSARDASHLAWLRDRIGDGFVRGIVFHTGPQPFELDERIWALPICSLWAATV